MSAGEGSSALAAYHPYRPRATTPNMPLPPKRTHRPAPAEVLAFYARLRGVPEGRIPSATAPLLAALGLGGAAAARPAGTYSGGNKRRLSVGAAFVGGPRVVLLDEPSTGMVGRGARRGARLWQRRAEPPARGVWCVLGCTVQQRRWQQKLQPGGS